MRKLIVGIALVLVLVTGCSFLDQESWVRFSNDTVEDGSGLLIMYGIRMGEAEHVGRLWPGDDTMYYLTPGGLHQVEFLDGYGVWYAKTDPLRVRPGRKYTMSITGSFESRTYHLIHD